MKTSKSRQLLALILAAIMMLCCIPGVSAAQVPEEEPLDPQADIYNGEYYYIASMSEGKMLACTTSGTLTEYRYSSSLETAVQWKCVTFQSDYSLRPKQNENLALTVDPTTMTVSLQTYTGSQYQKWSVNSTANACGDLLVCMASDSRVSYKSLLAGYGSFTVTNTGGALAIIETDYTFPEMTEMRITMVANETYQIDPRMLIDGYDPFPVADDKAADEWFYYNPYYGGVVETDPYGTVIPLIPGRSTYVTVVDKIFYNTCMVHITILSFENGAYTIRNPQTVRCATSATYPATSGSGITQTQYSYASGQFWYFEHVGDGYFTIETMANNAETRTGMYVTALGNTDGSEIKLYSLFPAGERNSQLWKVEALSSGYYKISLYGYPSLCFAIQDPTISGGFTELPIKLETYYDEGGNLDVWSIYEA